MEQTSIQIKERVTNLIAEVLKIDKSELSEYDNLIEIGVDSILMVDINSALKKKYGVQIQVSQFFGGINTIADISKYIEEYATTSFEEEPVELDIIKTTNRFYPIDEGKKNSEENLAKNIDISSDWKGSLINQFVSIVYQLDSVIQGRREFDVIHKITAGDEEKKTNKLSVKPIEPKKKREYIAHRKIDLEHREREKRVQEAILELTEKYNKKTKSSKNYAEKIRKQHADWRNVAGFRIDYKELIYQLVTKGCNGSKIIDLDDNEYIDLAMGFGVNLFGHKPSFIIDAIRQEMEYGFPLSMISKNIGEVSELICELTGMERVAYFNSGSEAVMVAVRIARARTGRRKIVYFAGAYHGTFDGLLGIQGEDPKTPLPMAVGILESMICDLIILNYGDENALAIIRENANDIAGVLVEPVQSRNPALQPIGFIKELREITKENKIALIFDEMITGFRISAGGAQEFYGVKADIATYGKIVGGGMPIGVVAGISEYMDCLDGGMWYYGDNSYPPHEMVRTYAGGTFCHHPLEMASAKAVLLKIRDEKDTIYPEINRKTQRLAEELNEFFEMEDIPMEVTYFGSLFRFETKGNLEIFYYYMLLEGIYIWEGRNCFLSLEHSDEDIDKVIATVKKVTRKMKGIFFGGKPAKEVREVTKQQAVMISHMGIEEKTIKFQESVMLKMPSQLEVNVFEASVQKIVNRHKELNLHLCQDNLHLQRITEPFVLRHYTCKTNLSEGEIFNILQKDINIYRERPIHMYMLHAGNEKYLMLKAHHLFIDGYSLNELVLEIFNCYCASVSDGVTLQLKEAMSVDEFEYRKAERMEELCQDEVERFWKRRLMDAEPIELPQVRADGGNDGYRQFNVLNKVQYLDIKIAASNYGCSPYMLMLTAVQILLSKISGQKSFTIGTPYAGQLLEKDFSIIGYVDKILPLNVRILSEFTVKDIINQNISYFSKLADYQYMFDEMCSEETISLSPDIHVVFNLDTIGKLELQGEAVSICPTPIVEVMYDLMINLTLLDNEVRIDFDYNKNKFEHSQVTSWLHGMIEIIEQISKGKNPRISAIRAVNAEDEKKSYTHIYESGDLEREFLEEIKQFHIDTFRYIVMDNYRCLVPEGTIGTIAVLNSKGEIIPTSWYGRIRKGEGVQIIDRKENTRQLNGLIISRSVIQKVLKGIPDVVSASIYMEKEVIVAELVCMGESKLTLEEVKKVCRTYLPLYMCPTEFYQIVDGKRTSLLVEELCGMKKEIKGICEEIIGCANIGQDENLFQAGMNSIQILTLFSKLEEIYHVRVVFMADEDGFTISGIEKEVKRLLKNKEYSTEEIVSLSDREYYETSAAQQRLFFEYKFQPYSTVYNISAVLYIEGKLEIQSWKDAIINIIKRHEILRSSFEELDGRIVQRVFQEPVLDFEVIETNLEEIPEKEILTQLNQFVKPFILERLPLLRVRILHGIGIKSVLLFDIHHIIFDGFSENIFFEELFCLLKGNELPELGIQYKDYAAWQNKQYIDGHYKKDIDYWKEKFPNGIPNTIYNFEAIDMTLPENKIAATISGKLDQSISSQITVFCKNNNISPFVFLLAIFCYTIKRYFASSNVLLGITLEGRNKFEIQNLLGFFVNNLPFFVKIKDVSVLDYINIIKKEFYDLMNHSNLQLSQIIEECGMEQYTGSKNVFDINFVYQDFNEKHEYYVGNTKITSKEYVSKESMFTIDLEVIHDEDKWQYNFRYNKALLLEKNAFILIDNFTECILQFLQNETQKLSNILLLDRVEGKQDISSKEIVLEKKKIAPRTKEERCLCNLFAEVLGLDEIGINDNFFELGGHSLKAILLVNRIEDKFGYHCTLREIFEHPTVEQMAQIFVKEDSNKLITKASIQEYYKMSPVQKRMYSMQQITGNTAYNLAKFIRFDGNLDIECLLNSFKTMIKRHEILRTCYFVKDGEFYQKVLDEYTPDIKIIEDNNTPEDKLYETYVQPFDLERGNVVRISVIKSNRTTFVLIDMHHIVADEVSVRLFIQELCSLYNGDELEDVDLQYKDYSEWLRQIDVREKQKFWKSALNNSPVLDIPLDYERKKVMQYTGEEIKHFIPHESVKLLRTFAQEQGVTEYMVLLSALMVTLSKYSKQEDIVVGSPVSGRLNHEMEHLMGMFVNTLPMRGKPKRDMSFKEFVMSIYDFSLEAFEKQDYPLEDMIEDANISKDPTRNTIFDVMLTMNTDEETLFDFRGVEVSFVKEKVKDIKLDLSFSVYEEQEVNIVSLEYCTELFRRETAKRILERFIEAIPCLIVNKDKKIGEVELLCLGEKEQIITEFNSTEYTYDNKKTITELFEMQVEKETDRIAIRDNDRRFTYGQLNGIVNYLARRLQKLGVGKDKFVAIYAERSIELIVGILGVIKAGAAYIPIDIKCPEDRIQYMLQDSDPKAVLTYNCSVQTKIPCISLEEIVVEGTMEDNLGILSSPNDLVYCIYTSGTTGKPKGVMIEQRSLINYITYTKDKYIDENPIIPFFTNYCFDLTVTSIFTSLLAGGTLICYKEQQFVNEILGENIYNMIKLTPMHLKILLEYADVAEKMTTTKSMILGGEALESEVAYQALKTFGEHIEIHNEYGPTEATVGCCDYMYEIQDTGRFVSIGRPIYNTEIYIMEGSTLCGIGVPGELCITGHGVARGYLNQKELTEDKFVNNPFGAGKMYRTGDLARWCEDGNLEFLGRMDNQVKIHGFRIELEEVESRLCEINEINNAAVIIIDNILYAYLVSDIKLDMPLVKEQLGKYLPFYMIPAYMTQIDQIPVTRNGKINKRELPKIIPEASKDIEPETEKEQLLLTIFEEVLGVKDMRATDNFFSLGGDSIKAIRIVSKVRELGYKIYVKDIMKRQTVSSIALGLNLIDEGAVYEQGHITGKVEYTPIQKQFFEAGYAKPDYYNYSVLVAAKIPLNIDVLRESLDAIVSHHDMLRAVFVEESQVVLPYTAGKGYDLSLVTLEETDMVIEKIEEECIKVQQSMCLRTGPLLKVAVITTKWKQYILFSIHHLVVDGVSVRILMEDINRAYKLAEGKKKIHFPEKTASYKEWSDYLREYTTSEEAKREMLYWNKVAGRIQECKSFIRKSGVDKTVYKVNLELDSNTTNYILYRANRAFGTNINDLLLAGLGMAIQRFSGNNSVVVALEGHGREQLHRSIDIDRTVGYFTSIYPIVLEVQDSMDDTIVQTKEMLRLIPNHGAGYGALMGNTLNTDLLFNYLGDYDTDMGFDNEESIFESCEYSAGNDSSIYNKQIYPMIVTGMIRDKKLSFICNYEGDLLKPDVESIMGIYKEVLVDIVDYCTKKDNVTVTASDFGVNDISMDDMQVLEDLLIEID